MGESKNGDMQLSKGCSLKSKQAMDALTPEDWESRKGKLPVMGEESIMAPKRHGTSENPVGKILYGCDRKVADKICNFNRHYAEYRGYFEQTDWLKTVPKDKPTTYYDSNTGNPLFHAPMGRTFQEFVQESKNHGWPSFRDEEVNWKYVRVLKDGECVSVDGTHLGHNLPSRDGRNRYCINLVSVAGVPKKK